MRNNIIERVEIEDIEFRGRGIARVDGKVIFVEATLPGEVVDIHIYQSKKDYSFARPVNFHQFSKDRISPFCEHFEVCGGCTWQNIPYEKQLEFKSYFVETAFKRIGKLQFPKPLPIIGCEKTEFYRNKMEFSFSNRRWLTKKEIDTGQEFSNEALGFHKPGHFDKVINIEKCHLQPDPSNTIRLAVRDFAIENDIPFFDIRKQTGLLRSLTIRISSLGEILLLFMFREDDTKNIHQLLDFVKGKFPQIFSLNYLINDTRNDSIGDQEIITYHGKPFINEKIGHIQLEVGPKSFLQTNTLQARVLYDAVIEAAELKGDEVIYDLYCGIGSIALYLASHCKKVVGVEILEAAIEDAKKNMTMNSIANCEFEAGDVRKVFNEDFQARHGKPDIIILDPPRAGLHPKVPKTLLEGNSPKIIYVSCNPVTQARDIQLLSEKYKITRIQPVDMFPHTFHVENVAVLKRV